MLKLSSCMIEDQSDPFKKIPAKEQNKCSRMYDAEFAGILFTLISSSP